MKIHSGKAISFPQPLAGMLKPFRYLYFAGFREREKLLEMLEAFSLRPAMFQVIPIGKFDHIGETLIG